MPGSYNEAKDITCRRCGGVFAVSGLASSLVCPHCQHVQAVPREQLERLERYAAQVGQIEQQAIVDEQAVIAHSPSRAPSIFSPEGRPFIRLTVIGGLAGVVVASLGVLAGAVKEYGFAIGQWPLGGWLMWPVLAILLGAAGAYAAWTWQTMQYRSHPRARAVRSSCPRCGAPYEHRPGQPVEQCAHCAAGLLPGERQMHLGLQHTAQQAGQIAQQRRAAEWEFAHRLKSSRDKGGEGGFLFMFGLWIPCGVLLSLMVTTEVSHPIAGPIAVTLAWLVLVAAPLWLLVHGWRAHKRHQRQWLEATQKLAARLGWQWSPFSSSLVRWLSTNWWGPYPTSDLSSGEYCGTVAFEHQGLLGLLHVDIWGRRLHVLIAAPAPALGDGATTAQPSQAAQHAAWALAREGFVVTREQAGILAKAQPSWLDWLAAHPDDLERVADVARRVAGLARTVAGQGA